MNLTSTARLESIKLDVEVGNPIAERRASPECHDNEFVDVIDGYEACGICYSETVDQLVQRQMLEERRNAYS